MFKRFLVAIYTLNLLKYLVSSSVLLQAAIYFKE